MNAATINPTGDQKALRNVARVKTLRGAIAKAQARGQADRVQSLTAELDRRMEAVEALKAALADV